MNLMIPEYMEQTGRILSTILVSDGSGVAKNIVFNHQIVTTSFND